MSPVVPGITYTRTHDAPAQWVAPDRDPLPGYVPPIFPGNGSGLDRLENASTVTWESLYASSDATLQVTLNKVPRDPVAGPTKIVTFPEDIPAGTYGGTGTRFPLLANFPLNVGTNGGGDSLRVGHPTAGGPGVLGLSGTVDRATGERTIFYVPSSNRVTPTPAASTNELFCITMDGGSANGRKAFHASRFRLEGRTLGATSATEPNGHHYGGLRIANATNFLVEDYIGTGITGGGKVPATGETFTVNCHQVSNGRFIRCEVDGRRNPVAGNMPVQGDVRVSAAGFGINNATNITFGTAGNPLDACYVHHTKYGGGGIAWYIVDVGEVWYMRSEYIGTGTGALNAYCFNHEQANRVTYHSPVMICNRTAGSGGEPATGGTLHMSLNSDSARGGVDNVLTVIDPQWDATNIGGGRFGVEVWDLGVQQVQRRVPDVWTDETRTVRLPFFLVTPYTPPGSGVK